MVLCTGQLTYLSSLTDTVLSCSMPSPVRCFIALICQCALLPRSLCTELFTLILGAGDTPITREQARMCFELRQDGNLQMVPRMLLKLGERPDPCSFCHQYKNCHAPQVSIYVDLHAIASSVSLVLYLSSEIVN